MKKKLLFIVHSLGLGGTEHLVVQMSLKLLSDYKVGILCLDSEGTMWEFCQKHRIELFCANRKSGFSLKNVLSISSIIKEIEPDVIHAHQYTPFIYSAFAKIIKKTKAKIIFTEHGRMFPDVISNKRKRANKYLLPQASAVTAVSNFTKKALIENEGVRSEIEVIYNGIEIPDLTKEDDSLRKKLKIPENIKIVGMLGSLRPVKNPLFLLQAFSVVNQVMSDVALVYVGEGELKSELEKEAADLGLKSKVFFAGSKWPAHSYLKEFSVFALPSKQEACSLAILEAMFLKIPVVVTNTGGSPELITANKTGLVVECGDERELASGIVELLTNTELRDDLVKEAKREVTSRFSFDSMLGSYKEIYENLI